MSRKRHREFVETLRESIVINECEKLNDDEFREDLETELQSELEEMFRKLFGTLETN